MRIVLVTPLYPPDTAPTALYIKELARRLAPSNDVTILAYAHYPELIPGVRIIGIDKRQPLPLRLLRYTLALVRVSRYADVLIIENGPSVELPLILSSWLHTCPRIVHQGDLAAHAFAKKNPVYGFLEKLARSRATTLLETSPLPRPEILPFRERPESALRAYEASWHEHLKNLEALFYTYGKH